MAKITKTNFKKLVRAAIREVKEYSPSFEYADEVMADSLEWYDREKSNIGTVGPIPEFIRQIVMCIIQNYI